MRNNTSTINLENPRALKIIHPEMTRKIIMYEIYYYDPSKPSYQGYAFPADKKGRALVEDMTKDEMDRFEMCLDNNWRSEFFDLSKAVNFPAVGLCACGRQVVLKYHINPCACGIDYLRSGVVVGNVVRRFRLVEMEDAG